MNILVLGASSSIGKSITKSFANKNKLFLLSTNNDKLNELKNELLSFGSQGVNLFEFDLGTPINVDKIIEENIDMVINVACSLSDLKNYNIEPNHHKYHTAVDLSNPLNILQYLLEKKINRGEKSQLYYIFVNTILTKIQSPENSIYYSYKILQQKYINGFKRKYDDILQSINVIVGTQIDRTKETKKSVKLAERIQSAIKNNDTEFIFGFEGKIVYALHRISPLLSDGLIYMKRYLFNNK